MINLDLALHPGVLLLFFLNVENDVHLPSLLGILCALDEDIAPSSVQRFLHLWMHHSRVIPVVSAMKA